MVERGCESEFTLRSNSKTSERKKEPLKPVLKAFVLYVQHLYQSSTMADTAEPSSSGSIKTPGEFLQAIKGKPVIVKLNSGVDYKGMCVIAVGESPRARWSEEQYWSRYNLVRRHGRRCHAPHSLFQRNCTDRYKHCTSPYRNVGMLRWLYEHRNGTNRGTSLLLSLLSLCIKNVRAHSPTHVHIQEYVDGQLKNKYGDCFIRGNNVLYISTAKQ